MFEVGLIQFLKNNTGIAALVSGRVFAGRIPKNADAATYPCIVWTVASTMDNPIISGTSGFRMKRVQLDCYDRINRVNETGHSYVANVRVADAVRSAFQTFLHGTFPDGTKVDSCVIISDQDFPDEPGDSGQLFRRMIEVQIAYQES